MSDRTSSSELGVLQARVAALESALAARPGRRWLGVALVLLLALVPAGLGASDRFTDVPDNAFYHDDANALDEAGITKGCFDRAHYCPNDVVTRGQMASFLARLGGLGSNPPVANALTTQTMPTPIIRTATVIVPGTEGPTPAEGTVVTDCGAGEVVIGGGIDFDADSDLSVAPRSSYPSGIAQWTAEAITLSVTPVTLIGYALCVPAAP